MLRYTSFITVTRVSFSRYNALPHYSMASMKQKQFNTLKQLIQISMMMTTMYIIHLFTIKMALVRLLFYFGKHKTYTNHNVRL